MWRIIIHETIGADTDSQTFAREERGRTIKQNTCENTNCKQAERKSFYVSTSSNVRDF